MCYKRGEIKGNFFHCSSDCHFWALDSALINCLKCDKLGFEDTELQVCRMMCT